MENPVQDIIIGNVSGALGAETQTNKAQNVSTGLDVKEPQTHDDMAMNITEQTVMNANVNTTANDNQTDETGDQTDESDEHTVDTNESHDQCAAVQTRAMVARKENHQNPCMLSQTQGWT